MKIAVVGDTLLDVDILGVAERLSPDAPVPVLEVQRTSSRAGGAGLVATMLARDGHDVRLVTALSDDARSAELRDALGRVPVLAGPSGAPTPVKTRLRAPGHAVARFDEGTAPPPPPTITEEMVQAVLEADVIVVADYGRGLTAEPRLREALARRGREVPLVWDPHPRGARPIAEATVATPNAAEAAGAAGIPAAGVAAAAAAAEVLRERWGCAAVVVTLGSLGAVVEQGARGGGLPQVLPAVRVDTIDPCGAGDRFAAGVAVELGRGASLSDAVAAGIRDASAFLAAGGVSSLDGVVLPELPVRSDEEAYQIAERVRRSGGTVVATGGCFDLLHAGHARTLSAARRLGDCLIVCLNSDPSVHRLKGEGRPIMQQQDRVDLLLALECVDAVLVFDEDTPERALRNLRPDIWVKGGDYSLDALPEAQLVSSWGGRAVTVPYIPGRSTTRLASALALVG